MFETPFLTFQTHIKESDRNASDGEKLLEMLAHNYSNQEQFE